MPYELEAITYCGNYIVAELYAKILEEERVLLTREQRKIAKAID